MRCYVVQTGEPGGVPKSCWSRCSSTWTETLSTGDDGREHPSGERFGGRIGRAVYESEPWWPELPVPEGLIQRIDGYTYTIKSGRVTFENGEPTGALPGKLLRGPQPAPATT